MIAFIRGQYINNFELQSYYSMLQKHPDLEMVGFSSLKPKHKVKLKTVKLFSPIDLPDFPKKLSILNRLVAGDAMYLWGLESKLKGFDLAHVRETYFHFSSQAIRAKQLGLVKKVLVTCSETIPFNHETIYGRKRLKKSVLLGADHFHCLTQKAKQCLITEGVSENKITVIPYGVDLQLFKPDQDIKKSTKQIRALFIGRLEEQKGVEELLGAFVKLKAKYSNLTLTVLGKGPLENEIKRYNIDIKFISYDKIPQIMNQSDFLILPSKPTQFWEEYLGMVLLEAMACGLPIVTTDCGAIPEVVVDCAIVVKHSNIESLYNGMEKMILTPNLPKELSSKGLKRVNAYFDAKKQSEKIYQMYQNILKLC